MSRPFVVAVLILEADEQARDYFKGKDKHDLETLTAGDLQFFIPATITDLFESEVHKRYPKLGRADLSCIWVEDAEERHFTVPLRNLNADEIRDVLSDLGDTADGVEDVPAWEKGFRERQINRKKTDQVPAMPNPPASTDDHPLDGHPEKQKDKDKDGGGKDLDILKVFGKYGGIGGLGLGVLFLLFGKLVFPTLTAEQATPYMFLIYGAAVLGLIIWATKTESSRSLKFLLAFVAVVIGVLAWLTLPRRKPPEVAYTVLVTVVSPSNVPVTNAHVTSSLGGEALQREGGWNINLPPSDEGKKLTVYADVADRGWAASADQQLGDNHSPTVKISLQETGELPVRGIVLDAGRRAVPNTQVGIEGYDAKFTDASGYFELASHAAKGETVHIHAEKPPNFVADKPDYKVGSGSVELILQSPEQQNPTPSRKKRTDNPTQVTGDAVIDRVIGKLNALQRAGTVTESQLADTLAPLFDRPAFYNTRQQDWRYFMYALCRTRLLLEQYKGEFKTRPAVRQNISDAVTKMVELQNEVASLYGPNFHIEDQIKRYINNSSQFVQAMPRQTVDPSLEFFAARDQQIMEIRQILHAAGIVEKP